VADKENGQLSKETGEKRADTKKEGERNWFNVKPYWIV
jgi:hypothetical protein